MIPINIILVLLLFVSLLFFNKENFMSTIENNNTYLMNHDNVTNDFCKTIKHDKKDYNHNYTNPEYDLAGSNNPNFYPDCKDNLSIKNIKNIKNIDKDYLIDVPKNDDRLNRQLLNSSDIYYEQYDYTPNSYPILLNKGINVDNWEGVTENTNEHEIDEISKCNKLIDTNYQKQYVNKQPIVCSHNIIPLEKNKHWFNINTFKECHPLPESNIKDFNFVNNNLDADVSFANMTQAPYYTFEDAPLLNNN